MLITGRASTGTICGILGDTVDVNSGTINGIAKDLEFTTDPHPTSPVVIDILMILGGIAAIAAAVVFMTSVESETSLGVPKVRFFTECFDHVAVACH